MASVPVTIDGVLFDKYGRTTQLVRLMGEAVITGLGIGGGPIIPPESGQPPDSGAHPEHPIYYPPHIWGPTDPRPTPPIYIPPAVPPSMKPPEAPEPGSPTTPVPGNWPVQPVTPPEYMVVNYPGIGPVVVAPPATAQPK
jgi:hypothetical protein